MLKRLLASVLVITAVGAAFAAAPKYPKFELYAMDQKLYSSLGLRGRAVLMAFFARNCPPCRMEVPFLNELYAKYPDTLTVLGIAFLESNYGSLKALMDSWGILYPVIPDPDGRVGKAFDQHVFPGSFLMDYRGEIVATYKGLSEEFNRDMVKRLDRMQPLIKEYRRKGPIFMVNELEESGREAEGKGRLWQSNITGWLKGKNIRVTSVKKEADYFVSGSVAETSGASKIEIIISNSGNIEEMSLSRFLEDGEEEKLREQLFEKLEQFPYVIR